MKKVTITCDKCQKVITNDAFITIGSTDEQSFKFQSEIKENCRMKKMDKYHDLHFCSNEHFIEFFFHASI